MVKFIFDKPFDETLIELDDDRTSSSIRLRTSSFVTYGSAAWSSTPLFSPQMFWMTSLLALSIAATRIHRSLVDFAHENTEVYDRGAFTSPPAHSGMRYHDPSESSSSKTLASGHTAPKDDRSVSLFTPPNRTEVAIHMAYEEYQTPSSTHSGSIVSTEEALGEKPAGLGLNDSAEKIA